MPLTTAQQAALDRLRSLYEGDNPYNSVTNPGGFRQGGHLYNFVPALKDIATVTTGLVALATEVATNSAQSPKAVRVDGAQNYSDTEKAQGQANLGLAAVLTSFVKKAGDTISGDLAILKTNPAIYFKMIGGTYDKAVWDLLHFQTDGHFYLQYTDTAGTPSNVLNIGQDGGIITSQLGDLSARIEARAAAYAALRVAKTGDVMTGGLTVPNLALTKGLANSGININAREAAGKDFLLYNAGGTARFWEASVGDVLRIGTDGGIWTLLLGDLNARIETRAKAFADIAQAAAAGESVSLSGDTATGDLAISKSNPQFGLVNTIAGQPAFNKRWGILHFQDGNLFFTNTDRTADNPVYFTPGGAIVTAQFGDLSTRIESRGLAYQQVAQSTSVQKAGDTMTGDLIFNATVGAGGPGVRLIMPSNADWLIRGIGGNQLQFCDGARSVQYFSLGSDGSISTKQFGDLNARIEARGSAYGESARTAAINASVSYVAWAFLADAYNSVALGGGMYEPYGGAAITGRLTYTESDSTWNVGAVRFRQLQYNIPSVGRVASFYG